MSTDNVGGILTYPVPTKMSSIQSGRFIDDDHWRKVADIFPLETNPIEGEELKLDDSSEKFEVKVGNGRCSVPSMAQEGFALVEGVPSNVKDFGDSEDVQGVYIDREVCSIVEAAFQQQSGGGKKTIKIVPFHWLVRDSRRSNYDSSRGPATFNGNSHAPVSRVHGDYTVENAPLRFSELQAKSLLPEAWDKDRAHWGIVNVWRNVADSPVVSKPLAVLDTTSLSRDKIFQYWLVKKDRINIGRNLAISHEPSHRWMYFPEMTNEEALVFFTYEANTPAADPRWVFHTAFDPIKEPATEEEKLDTVNYRTSIETRCLVVFDPKE